MDANITQFDPKSWGNSTIIIKLEDYTSEGNYPREFHNSLFIGNADNWNFPASSYKCRFNKVKFENVSFNNKDFKDCLFDDCQFVNCNITFASIVSSTYRNCIFTSTPFKDEAIHDCIFNNCIFNKASFIGSMIRNSTISNCVFQQCETSNKVFDSCFLYSNRFSGTNIDFRAIQDNFGLSKEQISLSHIREDRTFPNDKIFDFNKLITESDNFDLGAIELWKVQYFKKNSLVFYGEIMDNAFDIQHWMKGIQTPNNFVRFLEGFSEFILNEYMQNRCLYYLIVKLHALTYQLYKELNQRNNFSIILQAVSGIHVRTGQIISEVDQLIFGTNTQISKELIFRTDDGVSNDDISEIISIIKKSSQDFDYKIIKRNSPVDLSLLIEHTDTYVAVISFFLLSKTKLEIEKSSIVNINNVNKAKTDKEKNRNFSVGFGLAKENNSLKIFSMSSSMWGNYTVSLCLMIGTGILGKIRKILFELISAS